MIRSKTLKPSARQLTIDDLSGFGSRFGIQYHFPHMLALSGLTPILTGRVSELSLSSGLHFTHSSLEVLRSYESTSAQTTDLFLLFVLEGSVLLTVDGKRRTVSPGMAFTTRLTKPNDLKAYHTRKQHLKTITVALNCQSNLLPKSFSSLFENVVSPMSTSTRIWNMPRELLGTLLNLDQRYFSNEFQYQLFIEGIALQLVAYGLGFSSEAISAGQVISRHDLPQKSIATEMMALANSGSTNLKMSPGQKARLETIHRMIAERPSESYSIQNLATSAAMSVSSFRNKFQGLYGITVAEYISHCRLSLGMELLRQGYSVQQAAHFTGYRHASNFSTAFKRHFGTSPSQL